MKNLHSCAALCCTVLQCNAMQCNAMQCNAMQCNAMQCNAMQLDSHLSMLSRLAIKIKIEKIEKNLEIKKPREKENQCFKQDD